MMMMMMMMNDNILLGMYRIAIFKIRPEPDSTGYQTNYVWSCVICIAIECCV